MDRARRSDSSRSAVALRVKPGWLARLLGFGRTAQQPRRPARSKSCFTRVERLEDRQLLSGVTNLTPVLVPPQVVLSQLTQLVTGQPTVAPLPDTAVTSVALVGKGPAFKVDFQGTDAAGKGVASFQIFVSVDNAAAAKIATVPGGTPFKTVYSGSTTYQAIVDGKSHQYRFYSCGVDTVGGTEAAPLAATDDVAVSAQFATPGALVLQSFVVQKAAKERSFVRYLDVTFNQSAGLDALVASVNDANPNNDRIRLVRYSLDGSGPGVAVSLRTKVTAVDNVLAVDFGSDGIGGNANSSVGDGYYALQFDLVGNGTFGPAKHFYRLMGDVNGDRTVDSKDYAAIYSTLYKDAPTAAVGKVPAGTVLDQDVNGDGVVNARDWQLALQGMTHKLARWLVIDG